MKSIELALTALAICQAVNLRATFQLEPSDISLLQQSQQLDLEAASSLEATSGVRLVLKRRQKYLYDYFFPKNMRDDIASRKSQHKSNSSLSFA